MTDEKKHIDVLAMRRRTAETYDISIGMAAKHLAEAEKPDVDEMSIAKRASHLRFAEVYALLARACQKMPGSQF